MTIATLLATFLVLSAATPWSCAAPAFQPPPPGTSTPEPVPTEPPPGEPSEPPTVEPPGLHDEQPTTVPTPDPQAPCCFTNPSYGGVCEVTPVEDETCASILAYLNNPRSAGKTYCNSTEIRGGWKLATCSEEP